ncbi:hypothetical protein ABPG72_008610 [Tetrahymena utriculariae]
MMTGIIMLMDQYIQSHTILKILNNLILILMIFIINSSALQDKQNKLKFFDYFKKHQELKGWQKFLSEELPQSVFLVTKNETNEVLNNKKFNVENESLETKNMQNNKYSISDNENAPSKEQDSFQTKKNNEILFSQIANVNSIINKNQTEKSQTLYSFDFMNNRCTQFIFGNKDQQSDIKLLQKLIIQRKKEPASSVQEESLHSYFLKCENQSSSIRKCQKKKYFFNLEKERVSLDQLINQYFEGQNISYNPYRKQSSSSNNYFKSQNSQNNIWSKNNQDDSQFLSKFKPILIEDQVNCQHFLPNIYFDLKIYECNYNDKQSLMIIMDDISQKVMEERLRDVESYKEKLLSMITRNLKTPLNGIICILGNIFLSLEDCQDSESIQIVVSDTGIGMRESAVKKLNLISDSIQNEFDYQKGLGLGLQLINNLTKKIGPTQSLNVKKISKDGQRFRKKEKSKKCLNDII